MRRSEIRELTFKLIYSLEIQKNYNLDEQIKLYIQNNNIENNKDIEYIKECIYGIEKNKEEINKTIEGALTENWKIGRISKVNLSLLILAIYEIKYQDIPFKVEINEVVELAKTYGEEKSSGFINGALAKVVKELN